MRVNQKRLRQDIQENATFGSIDADEGEGRTVLTGSKADRLVRERFIDRLDDAGLKVRVDAIGNIVGRWNPQECDCNASPVAVGSHLDSVPRGGIFDGPLGTYGALEAVRALKEEGYEPSRPIEVVCFTEEEGGRFNIGTLGSSVATGHRDVEEALALTDGEGVTLGERLEGIGFAGNSIVDARSWKAWLELHIEQGTRLREADAGVGIVDSITGITNCEVTVQGEADHAGSTSMCDRTDALAAGSAFVLALERAAREEAANSDAAVGTAGSGSIAPNVRNIIPAKVQYQLDIRDVTEAGMDRLVERCRSALNRLEQTRGVATMLDRYRHSPPTTMSERCTGAIANAATKCGVDAIELHSAAMHDTANVATVTDAGLLFAPSEKGVSHSPKEWTDWEECAAATAVLGDTLRSLTLE
ncbi:M20 family metallo-hydrolase [Halopenitus persicus]|nr:M20 family metallo-hydrolase [Halopenitus persicus]